MAVADFVVPDEETESSPSLDDLIAIFPSDEGTNRLNATKLRNLLARIPDDTITEAMLTDELQEILGDLVSVQYAETDSETDSDWHDTKETGDGWLRIGIGETPTYTTGIPLEASIEVSVEYAETDSDDDNDWDTAQTNDDNYFRLILDARRCHQFILVHPTTASMAYRHGWCFSGLRLNQIRRQAHTRKLAVWI